MIASVVRGCESESPNPFQLVEAGD